MAPMLSWLPEAAADLSVELKALAGPGAWPALVAHANTRLEGMGTVLVERALRRLFPDGPPAGVGTVPLRLGVYGSSTLEHLVAGIRVGALRRGIWCSVSTGEYGGYAESVGEAEGLDAVLLALDARHVTAGFGAGLDAGEAAGRLDGWEDGGRSIGGRESEGRVMSGQPGARGALAAVGQGWGAFRDRCLVLCAVQLLTYSEGTGTALHSVSWPK